MKQVYKWKLGVAVAALVFSVVSALAEINESLLIYYIASIGYIIIMTVFIVLSILSQKSKTCIDGAIKLKKFKTRFDGISAFILFMIAIIGMILHLNDADILILNIFDVLFTLCLVIKVTVDILVLYNIKE